jgi:hypothetical protein
MMHVISFAKLCASMSVNVLGALHSKRGTQVCPNTQNSGRVIGTSTIDAIAISLCLYRKCVFLAATTFLTSAIFPKAFFGTILLRQLTMVVVHI